MNNEVHIIAAEWHKYTNIDKPDTTGHHRRQASHHECRLDNNSQLRSLPRRILLGRGEWRQCTDGLLGEIPEQLTAIQKATVDEMLRS